MSTAADRNRNFLARDSVKNSQAANNNAAAAAAEELPSTTTSTSAARKEGLYAKKDNSNYQRFVEDATRKGPAPLLGWQNGSPTLLPSSPEAAEPTGRQCQQANGQADTPPESSGIGKDEEGEEEEEEEEEQDTENPSSIADEKNAAWTPPPGLAVDKSIESFEQDADLSLATASSPDLEQDPRSGSKQRAEDKTEGGSESRSEKTDKSPGILVRRKYSETETSSLPGYSEKDQLQYRSAAARERDSIDGSSTMLEIYDDEEEEEEEEGAAEGEEDGEEGGEDGQKRAKQQKQPRIPDGGWGWVVVVSSLVISMIADGVSFSFGLLYSEFLLEFEASKATTSWIGSLFMAVPLLSGPIMSALVDRYGCRRMTIAGGVISGTGFVLSSYVHSIGVMYLTFGVLAGLGLGLCYVTAVVSIAFWFDKKRTLAVGLGACGTGIGTFLYAPMTTFFISEYGWRGCVLLLSGTFFNMIVCGCVMRDPEWWIQEQKKQQAQLSPKKLAQELASSCLDGRSQNSPAAVAAAAAAADEDFPGLDELRRLMKSGQAPEYLLHNLRTSTETRSAVDGNPAFRSVVNLPTFVRQSEKVPLEVLESLSSNSRVYNVILENYPSLLLCRSASDKKLDAAGSNGDINNKSGVTMSMRVKQAKDKDKGAVVTAAAAAATAAAAGKKTQSSRPGSTHASTKVLAARRMSRKDLEETNPLLAREVAQAIAEAEKRGSRHHLPGCMPGVVRTDSLPWLRRQFSTNTHYFKDIRVHRNSVMYRGAVLNLHKYRLRASSCPNIYRNSMTTLAKENEEKWYSELVDLLNGMMDFSMFSELHFLLLSLSTILLFTWFIVPYFYLAEYLRGFDYGEAKAANLLSWIGITNTIGMIGLGWAGDQPWMNVTKTYTWCLIACGISVIMMPILVHNDLLLGVTCCCFGLFFASNFSFTPVILVEIIPLERFTTAYGLSLLCQGIGNLLGPPLAGLIFDLTKRWDLSFFMAGAWIIVSGLLMGFIPYTKNKKIWGSGPVETERERECLA